MTDAATLTAQLVPEPPLRAWIDDRLAGEGPFTVERITTGHSNEMFLISRSGGRWVLRRPPRVMRTPRGHDMSREFRVLAALSGSGVPHATPRLLCEDASVIGSPFYVMDELDGMRLYDSLPETLASTAARREVAEELFDALAAVHNLSWQDAHLCDFGRPAGFTDRQVDRWMKQLDSYRVRPLPALDEAAQLLRANIPVTQRDTLIHGDYGLHNVLYASDLPVRITGVVDWETATIGDPLIDLGYLTGLWLEGDEPERWFASALPYDATGFPGRDELAKRYADATGLDLSELSWYRAVAQLKVACILEGSYAAYMNGKTDDPHLATFEQAVPNHAEYALAIARGKS